MAGEASPGDSGEFDYHAVVVPPRVAAEQPQAAPTGKDGAPLSALAASPPRAVLRQAG